ncbi:MAG TPA: hypothetical protein VMR88_13110 [Candidatus Polarisedimenticolaceae bacterium]|nr:hypothetical protein [Candidatus Polarisedimenticolaceae bacterium]
MKLALLTIIAVTVAACTSPEANRSRGGGPGADMGNRSSIVRMHEGSRPFEQTPRIIGAEHPPLEPARQASEFSRR